MRMRSRLFAVSVGIALMSLCFAGVYATSRAAATPRRQQIPNAPPEIQRILDKAKSGERLTQAEIQKLTEWSKKLQERFNSPAGGGTQAGSGATKSTAGIPCDITITSAYTRSRMDANGSEREVVDVGIHTRAVLFATIKGKGNYFKDILNPDVDASSFRFDAEVIGGGTLHSEHDSTDPDGHSHAVIDGHFEKAFCSMLFTTIGTDRLFCTGQCGGVLNGTERFESTANGHSDSGSREASASAFGGSGDAGVPFAAEALAFAKATATHQAPEAEAVRAQLSFQQFSAAVTSGKPQTITIPENFSVTTDTGWHIEGRSTVRITLRPPPLELIVEPENYNTWVPEGGAAEDTQGNKLNIKATLMPTNGKALASKIAVKKFTFQLEKVSREPGVCMNWPVTQPADDSKPDMKFEASENPKFTISGAHGETAISTQGDSKATARLTSFDWGGWADLKVTAELADGTRFEGHLKAHENEDVVRLPKRKEGAHVADAWKEFMSKSCGRALADLDDNDDSEAVPVGNGKKGDGYTLYEEYRGFLENSKHFRASPGRKKLFVRDEVGDRSKDGIALFRQVSNLDVHDDFTLEEFGQPNNDPDDFTRTKILNANHRDGAHVVDQHGIVLEQSLLHENYAEAVRKDPHGIIGSPKRYKYIEITTGFSPGPEGWNSIVQGGSQIVTDNYASCVAHEMLHCCSVQHHGENDIGIIQVSRAADGHMFRLGDADVDVTLTAPDGSNYDAKDPFWNTPQSIWWAGNFGQHSGNEDCVMRYNCAGLFEDHDHHLILLFGAEREKSGIGLCRSGAGTGVNAQGHPGGSRYQDASLGRGDCAHQLCVNDLYN